jgi:hypothetical protein
VESRGGISPGRILAKGDLGDDKHQALRYRNRAADSIRRKRWAGEIKDEFFGCFLARRT